MHLCGIRSDRNSFVAPPFDIRDTARPLAVYSYLVHIIRDFQKDQTSGLNYFADDMMIRHGVKTDDLHRAARAENIEPSVRDLMRDYYRVMLYYQAKARRMVDNIRPTLLPRYQVSLEIIYHLYHQISERIDVDHGRFTGVELNPSADDVQRRIDQVILSVLS